MNHTFTVLEGDCDLDGDLPAQLDFTNLKPDWEQTEKRRAIARAGMVRLDPDLAEIFADSITVNATLRELLARRQSESAGVFAQG